MRLLPNNTNLIKENKNKFGDVDGTTGIARVKLDKLVCLTEQACAHVDFVDEQGN